MLYQSKLIIFIDTFKHSKIFNIGYKADRLVVVVMHIGCLVASMVVHTVVVPSVAVN